MYFLMIVHKSLTANHTQGNKNLNNIAIKRQLLLITHSCTQPLRIARGTPELLLCAKDIKTEKA